MTTQESFNVMIIDDNEHIRTLLRMIIQSEKFNVVGCAGDGIAGLALAHELHPDIICLDVLMPESNGLQVLVNLKLTMPKVAVLMVTGVNDRETVEVAIEGGACGYILKPFNPGIVMDSLDKAATKLRTQVAVQNA